MRNESGLMVTGDKILVRPHKVEEKSSGGIILPALAQKREQNAQQMGVLVAIGDGCLISPDYRGELEGIALGETIVFSRYAFSGGEFFFDDEAYWFMNFRAVLGKLTKLPDYFLRGAEHPDDVFGEGNPLQQAA